jgi:hypothetical protein
MAVHVNPRPQIFDRHDIFHSASSMIPTFTRVVERQHHIHRHNEVDEILDYLTRPVLEGRATAKIAGGTHISETTLPDWHRQTLADESWFPLANGHPREAANRVEPAAEKAGRAHPSEPKSRRRLSANIFVRQLERFLIECGEKVSERGERNG